MKTITVSLDSIVGLAKEARLTHHIWLVEKPESDTTVTISEDEVWLIHKTHRQAFGRETGLMTLSRKGFERFKDILWIEFNHANQQIQRHPGLTKFQYFQFWYDQITTIEQATARYIASRSQPASPF